MVASKFTICVVGVLLGCGPESGSIRDPERYESGVVENVAPVWNQANAWHLDTASVLSIGEKEARGTSPFVFGEIIGAVRLSDGRIAVADAHAKQVRYFAGDGRFLRSTGRNGGGPGEFRSISWIGECGGDSVFVYDYSLARMSVLNPSGEFARAFVPQTSVTGRGPSGIACSDGGFLAVATRSNDAVRRKVGPHRLTAPIAVISRTGHLEKDLGRFPGPDRYRHPGSDGPLPLGKDVSVAVHGNKVFIGTADTYSIGVFASNGRQRALIRKAGVRQRITAADRNRYIQQDLDQLEDVNQRREMASWYRGLSFPEFFPAYSVLLTDPDGNLWVQDYLRPGEDRTKWSVFDGTGRYLGTLSLPERFTALHVGSDFVLGRWVDSLGVATVRQYPLQKP